MKKWNLSKALVVYKEEASHPRHGKTHFSSLQKVCLTLQKHHVQFRIVKRENLKKRIPETFVITVGGDGTFLHASHFSNSKHLLLGINSVPEASHGAFCYTDAFQFEKILPRILAHKVPIHSLSQLEIRIPGKKTPYFALNDILFANPSPAGTSRYLLEVGKKKEEHKSSGVWVSTPSGSTAAIRSAGGKILPKHSEQFQFLIREPFQQGKKKLKILKGLLKKSETLKLSPRMSKAGLFIDGAHIRYDLKYGDRAEIRLAKEKIWAVMR